MYRCLVGSEVYSLVFDIYASSSFRGSLVHAPSQSVKVLVHSDEGLFSCRLHLLVRDEASSVVTLGMVWFGSYKRWAGTGKGSKLPVVGLLAAKSCVRSVCDPLYEGHVRRADFKLLLQLIVGHGLLGITRCGNVAKFGELLIEHFMAGSCGSENGMLCKSFAECCRTLRCAPGLLSLECMRTSLDTLDLATVAVGDLLGVRSRDIRRAKIAAALQRRSSSLRLPYSSDLYILRLFGVSFETLKRDRLMDVARAHDIDPDSLPSIKHVRSAICDHVFLA
ncbi:hypothetical protein EDD85DRAFT_816595 [Armillaria nabsnona]|nr:hypothetical protein EDD85DRAFT_816595 [Armillaria nabsnona]